MNNIKIAFSDFWIGFKPELNWFYLFLKDNFSIELSDKPDYLIYSVYGNNHLNFDCIKIFYTAENVRPDFYFCDYALSFDFLNHAKHLRLPLYSIIYGYSPEKLLSDKLNDIDHFLNQKKEFCAMVVSQPKSLKRIEFFHKLSKYKKVHSGGKVLNNVGGPVGNKLDFISKFKFTFAFENTSYPGYVTEKIFEPMLANSIPVYWGSPVIHLDFNPKSFVNYHDFNNDDDVIGRIIELDEDRYKMAELLAEPWFHNNQLTDYGKHDKLLEFFRHIFSTPIIPVSSSLKGKISVAFKQTRVYLSRLKKI